jgi:glycosyltransferase involved in cell wall biosynthesis
LYDTSRNLLPIVLVSGFFRDDDARDTYYEYIKNGIKVAGITAYKSFPKKITDKNEDEYHHTDPFDYHKNINNWMCCFSNPEQYGLSPATHNLIDISESDFYDTNEDPIPEKKYDFIYSCLQDDEESCPMEAWNSVNRNFKAALECLPIMINEYKLKVLVVGRSNCGLEEKYGDGIEIVKMLPYHEFQEKVAQSRFLFVPNIYDASPRVITEAISKGLPVLMNRSILCGSKYINYETGEFFTDSYDIRYALDQLLAKYKNISPKKWWKKNYGKKEMGKKMRNYLVGCYPGVIDHTPEVYF